MKRKPFIIAVLVAVLVLLGSTLAALAASGVTLPLGSLGVAGGRPALDERNVPIAGPGDAAQPSSQPTAAPTIVPQPTALAISGVDPALARDAALAHLASQYGIGQGAANLSWEQRNVSPEGVTGAVTLEYAAGAWKVTVRFPLVRPELTTYTVAVTNEATDFQWECTVNVAPGA